MPNISHYIIHLSHVLNKVFIFKNIISRPKFAIRNFEMPGGGLFFPIVDNLRLNSTGRKYRSH